MVGSGRGRERVVMVLDDGWATIKPYAKTKMYLSIIHFNPTLYLLTYHTNNYPLA